MSSRGLIGSANRQDLFEKTPRTNRSNEISVKNANDYYDYSDENDTLALEDEKLYQEYGLGRPEESPLQLEKVIGYIGEYRNTLKMSPIDESEYVRSLGCLVSFESLSDSNHQKCLRAHDMNISALDYSLSGTLVASGQVGTKNFKGYAAPVFIWHAKTHRRLQVLKGLTIQVNFVSFSPDERFICAGGEDSLIYIWDIATTEVIYCHRFPNPISAFSWVLTDTYSQNEYEIVFGLSTGLQKGHLIYDPTRVLWNLKISSYSLTPSVSATRVYTTLGLSVDQTCVLVGTTVGEMLVFRRDTSIFRASIPVCSNGLQCITTAVSDGSVICGGGDGSLKKLKGHDLSWTIVSETILDSAIKSIAISPNRTELIVACSSGSIYRCLLSNFTKAVIQCNHTSILTSISFNYDTIYPTNLFATGSYSGEVRVWDVNDYACQAVMRLPKSGKVNCVKIIRNEYVISGWEDGFIRCHDASTLNRQIWFITNAHRGGVTSLDIYISDSIQYLVTGGADNTVRVWKLTTRELINQCNEHKKPIQRVLVDSKSPNIIHSISLDGTVLSYDLKASRRVMYHMIPDGSMTDMTQRKDSELELITTDNYGRLMQWDIDYRESTQVIQDPSRKPLRSCSISPSGKYIAMAGDDEVLKVIDLDSTQIIALGQGHSDSIQSIAWTSDERQVITSGLDGCLCIWNFFFASSIHDHK